MNKLLGNDSGPRDFSHDIWAKSMRFIDNHSKRFAVAS